MKRRVSRPQGGTAASAKPAARTLSEEVDALAELLRRHDLTELEIERAGERIRLSRAASAVGVVSQALAAPPTTPAPPPAPVAAPLTKGAKAETTDGNISYITSPFVGTFYRSPGPEAAPFVDVGTRVRKGQVLCIVEAMKLMNEIESEIEGVVVACLVENGHPVEYGEPLFKIRQE